MRTLTSLVIAPALILSALALAPVEGASASPIETTAAQLLAELTTAAPSTVPYSRTQFVHWVDADNNGCDTRGEVLIRQSTTPVVRTSSCTVTSGRWDSWYDGATWTAASDVDIDHFVPLSEAWKSGAYGWTAAQRQAYANDLDFPLSLVAVTDNVNQSKSDSDPATWLPPLSSTWCRYATDWVLVKYRWHLSVDTTERAKLNSLLAHSCGSATVATPTRASVSAVVAAPSVQRLSGADRYATAVSISRQYPAGVPVVYIATGANFPDALSAAPAAALQGGPLLLTAPTKLPDTVITEIKRLSPQKIIVVGGTGAVSASVYSQLSKLTASIRRDSGADRYATSQTINRAAFSAGSARMAYVATGSNFPDALSASAAAASSGSPVMLVAGTGTAAGAATTTLMKQLGVSSVRIAGGTGAVSARVESSLRAASGVTSVSRLAGADRYTTSSAINRTAFATASTVYFAVGTNFADALAGAALAGRNGAPLYVVPATCVPADVIADLNARGTSSRVLLGGTGALGAGVASLTPCAVPKPPVKPTPPPVKPTKPGDKNCSDFPNQAAAQSWFNTYFPYYGDIARLDSDGDRIACESLK
ncbi:cell wall-binding repeat-containing protein [Leifsonia sp. Root112D2]|uniref:cell wall-binding repeat-containing protein n=1 Tax=Leifsonia sp. Root112D2 TaxID=1736426 RepID=UPI0009E79FD9|nr:cell wall-binding repeat-containing protein [Leifsonia sp. Root112D2]